MDCSSPISVWLHAVRYIGINWDWCVHTDHIMRIVEEEARGGERDQIIVQTSLTVNPGKYMAQCSITYISCCVCVMLQLHYFCSCLWEENEVAAWWEDGRGVAAWDNFVTDRKCSLLSHDTVLTWDQCLSFKFLWHLKSECNLSGKLV